MHRRPEGVLGKDDREFFAPETAQRIMEEDREVMESGKARTYVQEANVLGVTRHYLATRVPYRDEEGKILGVMGISRDVTAQKKSEQELREAKEAAESANKSKDRFLAILEKAAQDGVGIVMIDSDFENLSLLCHRVVVMHEGRIAAELTGADVESPEAIARAVFLANPSLAASALASSMPGANP